MQQSSGVFLFIFPYFYISICFTQFTLFAYKSLIMIVENFQKYHRIQHKKTQPVVVTREQNKSLWTSEASESLLIWHIYFICIQIFNNCRKKIPKIPLDSTKADATCCCIERAFRSNLVSVKSIQTPIF